MLLCVLTLALLAVTATNSSSSGGNLSGQALRDLYNSGVYKAEWMVRPMSSSLGCTSRVPYVCNHTGVRVTLANGDQWLIHKGLNYGSASDTVVTSADNMSSDWRPVFGISQQFNGRKTVSDFVKRGGESYNVLFSNCHVASVRMMLQ